MNKHPYPSLRVLLTPLFALGFVLAARTMSGGLLLAAQETGQGQKGQADDVETQRKQVQALKQEVETLKRQLAEERRRADEQEAVAARERARAEASLRQARDVLDRLLAQPAGTAVPPEKVLRKELLEQALKHYQQLVEKKDGGAAKLQELARALQRIGWIQQYLGKSAEAEKAYRQSIQLAESLVREFPKNSDYRRDLARAYGGLADVFRATGRTREANEAAERAKALGDAPK